MLRRARMGVVGVSLLLALHPTVTAAQPAASDDAIIRPIQRMSPIGGGDERRIGDWVQNRVEELMARLPEEALCDLRVLSPSRNVEGVQADLFIVHDRGDPYVPYVESRRMRDRLAGREDLHYTEVSLFEHVEPNLRQGGDILVLDGTRLYFRLYQLLLRLT